MPLSFNFGPDNDPQLLAQRPKTPVTLLAGFLGAGILGIVQPGLEEGPLCLINFDQIAKQCRIFITNIAIHYIMIV